MTADVATAALTRRYLLDYPGEAARRLEALPLDDAAAVLGAQAPGVLVRVWEALADDAAEAVLDVLPEASGRAVLTDAAPARSAAILARLGAEARARWLAALDPEVARDLGALLDYPPDSAGRLMDPRSVGVRAAARVADAVARLRARRDGGTREAFVVDDERRLVGRVGIEDLAFAEPDLPVGAIARPPAAVVQDVSSREDVVDTLNQRAVETLPVVDHAGRLVGVIRQSALVAALQEETSVDVQTMVGASRDERALSSPLFAVRKRLPWLQINLLTAFLAAAVVGLFEDTIARFTALAVLLPVVAGQSGNAGAQALAVTMRGLVLRELGLRQWPRVVGKEASVGLVNGLAVAATTALGVWVWSGSAGLVLVIAVAMVISMVVAGVAGALVPVALRRFGQDPAQSSSIILTTVTDVVGFFSFLGIATALAGLLEAGG